MIENNIKSGIDTGECKNIFVSDPSDIGENFMRLWLHVICERESGLIIKRDRQTVS